MGEIGRIEIEEVKIEEKFYTIELSKYRENLDSLNAKRRSLIAFKRKEKSYSDIIEAKKNLYKKQVSEEMEGEKKKYTNESMREAGIADYLYKDADYQDNRILLDDNKYAQQNIELDIAELSEELRYWRLVIDTLNVKR